MIDGLHCESISLVFDRVEPRVNVDKTSVVVDTEQTRAAITGRVAASGVVDVIDDTIRQACVLVDVGVTRNHVTYHVIDGCLARHVEGVVALIGKHEYW